ncbi:hypothetical protein [Parageobacillus thermoglucosidasius]|uniref:hypothetical protein n=1 Tax=Parageobacillus thermoglucosidasius TaxID=1426 RepID=UPI0027F9F657|nr:hypothetical protein PthstB1num2_36310 [Parageobacillus thermoglucosidasius]
MNHLQQVFNYSGSQVRTIVKDGEVWFVAYHALHKLLSGTIIQQFLYKITLFFQ